MRVEQIQELIRAAVEVREHAYSPYSGYAVGAAVLTNGDAIHTGCNVENASYGLSICAERNALAAAVAAGMRRGELQAVALVAAPAESNGPLNGAPARNAGNLPVVPCGACLQVLAEFAAPDCMVISAAGPLEHCTAGLNRLDELLPLVFRL